MPVTPATGGVKVTPTVHVAPAATVEQVLLATAKLADAVTPVTVIGLPDVLVSVVDTAGEVVFIDCPPKSSDAGLAVIAPEARLNVAVTPLATSIVTLQAADPEHAPLQPAKTDPLAGMALRLTDNPTEKLPAHELPQSMPAGDDVTVPLPEPDLLIVSVVGVGVPTT